jgi:hypothetical protein
MMSEVDMLLSLLDEQVRYANIYNAVIDGILDRL